MVLLKNAALVLLGRKKSCTSPTWVGQRRSRGSYWLRFVLLLTFTNIRYVLLRQSLEFVDAFLLFSARAVSRVRDSTTTLHFTVLHNLGRLNSDAGGMEKPGVVVERYEFVLRAALIMMMMITMMGAQLVTGTSSCRHAGLPSFSEVWNYFASRARRSTNIYFQRYSWSSST